MWKSNFQFRQITKGDTKQVFLNVDKNRRAAT